MRGASVWEGQIYHYLTLELIASSLDDRLQKRKCIYKFKVHCIEGIFFLLKISNVKYVSVLIRVQLNDVKYQGDFPCVLPGV